MLRWIWAWDLRLEELEQILGLRRLRFLKMQGSLNATHFGGIKKCKAMITLMDVPPKNNVLFGLVSYHDPC